jgi:hypothetical protein
MPLSRPLELQTFLETRSLDPGHELHRILKVAMEKFSEPSPSMKVSPHEFWASEHFGLENVHLFQESSIKEKKRILTICNQGLLEESLFIEQLGLSYSAKMTLLSETTEERMLYCLFAADEAAHLHYIRSFLPPDAPKALPSYPFFELLADIVTRGDKISLTYLLQVVLEGWGITHYQILARDCRYVPLSQVLKKIVRQEALHHGSGVSMARQQNLSTAHKTFIMEMLVRLFQMVQAGPQQIVSNLEKVKGHLSKEQKIRVFRELRCEVQSRQRLDLLRSLIDLEPSLTKALASYNVYEPLSPEACACWTS